MVLVEVRVELKKGVADPEGKNTEKALGLLGIQAKKVKSVKVYTFEVDGDEKEAMAVAEEACSKLLANPVVHNYRIEVR